jgi:hypothetical protein
MLIETLKNEPHFCTPESCPEPGKYFVTATGDSGRHFWCMAGPYSSHAAALAKVAEATRIADKHDGRAWFMAWGTAKLPDDSTEIGRLQKAGYMPTATPKENNYESTRKSNGYYQRRA